MSEVEQVKILGEQIGYGHMMELTSALWRKSLRDRGYPTSGAFIPTCPSFVKKKVAKEVRQQETMDMYDKLIETDNG